MEHLSAVPISGRACVRTLWGRAMINGYVFEPDADGFLPLCSVASMGQLVIRTLPQRETKSKNDFNVESSRRNLLSAYCADGSIISDILKLLSPKEDNVAMLFRKLHSPVYPYLRCTHRSLLEKSAYSSAIRCTNITTKCEFTLEMRASNSIRWDSSRENIVKEISESMQNDGTPPRVLVCGGSNVGKSTFCRHVVNSLLNICKKVSWFDCDPGQSEFTPHGVISVVEVDKPLLGPSFTHQKTPRQMCFVGGTSVADCPLHYMRCVEKLFEYWSHESDLCRTPLLINTMGWRRGLGILLLADIIRLMRPTHIVQIDITVYKGRNMPALKPNFVAKSVGLANVSQRTTDDCLTAEPFEYHYYNIKSLVNVQITPPKSYYLHDLAMGAYFSQLHYRNNFLPLNECSCYKVPWSAVALHVCNQIVPRSEILYVFNGNLVALCECKPEEVKLTSDSTLPKFLDDVPVCECFGYGIVRAVSMEKKCLYVITPVSAHVLHRVNALLVGSGVHLPVGLLKKQSVSSQLPYLTCHKRSVPFAITNRHVKPRKFKKRSKKI